MAHCNRCRCRVTLAVRPLFAPHSAARIDVPHPQSAPPPHLPRASPAVPATRTLRLARPTSASDPHGPQPTPQLIARACFITLSHLCTTCARPTLPASAPAHTRVLVPAAPCPPVLIASRPKSRASPCPPCRRRTTRSQAPLSLSPPIPRPCSAPPSTLLSAQGPSPFCPFPSPLAPRPAHPAAPTLGPAQRPKSL